MEFYLYLFFTWIILKNIIPGKLKETKKMFSLHRKLSPESFTVLNRNTEHPSQSPSSADVDVSTHAQGEKEEVLFDKALSRT